MSDSPDGTPSTEPMDEGDLNPPASAVDTSAPMSPEPVGPRTSPEAPSPKAETAADITDAAAPVSQNGAVIDFRRPAPLLGRQAKVLRSIHEDLCERLSPMLSSRLRTPCRLSVPGLEMVSGEEFQVPEDCAPVIAVVDFSPLGSQVVLRLDPLLAAVVSNLLLGGPGENQDPRTLTEVEVSVLAQFLQQWLPSFALAWQPVVALQPRIVAAYADPEVPIPVQPGEPSLRVDIEFQFGDVALKGDLWIPNGVLAAALRGIEPLSSVGQSSVNSSATRGVVVDVLRSVPVNITVTFPPVGMTPAAILSLEVGDVIRLHPVDQPLELSAGDIRIGWVRPAQHAGRTACQVMSLESSRLHSVQPG